MSKVLPVPLSWTTSSLGQLCRVVAGVGFPVHLQGKSTGPIPFYKVGDISEAWQQGRRFLSIAHHYVTSAVSDSLGSEPLPSYTTVLAKIGAAIALNRRAMLSQPALVDNNVFGIVPDVQVLDPSYLFYFACTLRLGELSRATTVPSLRKGDVESITVPLPPLSEQRRIVLEVDKQLTRLDDAFATLRRVHRNLKRYRASVLKAAVEGRLVPAEAELTRAEGRTYEPASVLLERILVERRQTWEEAELAKMTAEGRVPKDDKWKTRYVEPVAPDFRELPELPQGWCWSSVDQLGSVSGGLTQHSRREALPLKLPYLRVANVYANELRLDDVQLIGIEESEKQRVLLENGDILVVEGNGSLDQIGRVALWKGSVSPCLHQNHLIKIRFSVRELASWTLFWLLSVAGRREIVRVASSTSGLHTLSLSKVGQLPVPLPPLGEQGRSVAEVERLLSATASLESEIEADRLRTSRLRQSILKWAFEGRLVDQDPDDEPASVLLERIKAERQAQALQPASPRKRHAARTKPNSGS